MSDEPSQVIARHREELLGIDGVHAVAWGLSPTVAGKACILVYGSANAEVPDSLDGLAVELVESGEFHAR